MIFHALARRRLSKYDYFISSPRDSVVWLGEICVCPYIRHSKLCIINHRKPVHIHTVSKCLNHVLRRRRRVTLNKVDDGFTKCLKITPRSFHGFHSSLVIFTNLAG